MKKIIICFIVIFTVLINTSYSQNPVNHTAKFNGFYNYVTVSGDPLNAVTSFTLEAWVNPTSIGSVTMSVIGKNYQTGFFLGIQSSGRIVFYPRGGSSLRSRVTGTVPEKQWTHIAATYNGSLTSIYINGILDTSTTAITGALTANNDSIHIGADKIGAENLFFYGYMDNVRIWRSARNAEDIKNERFIPFSVYNASGKYSTLAASFLFNNNVNNSGAYFSEGIATNIEFVNFSNKAGNICDYNNNLALNGTTDYCSHENSNGWFNMPGSFTIECWVRRDTTSYQPLYQNLINKSGGTNVFDYGLYFSSAGDLYFAINNFSYIASSPGVLQSSQWTHLAASYDHSSGRAVIYCNGDSAGGAVFSGNPSVQNNNFQLYIGGTGSANNAANKLKGQIDDIKIWYKSVRSQKDIKGNMYSNSISKINSADSVIYINFDKYQTGVFHGGGAHIGGLKYYGNASVSSAHANTSGLSSPVMIDPQGELNSSKFTLSSRKFYVPDVNLNGITDSIFITEGAPVNNLRVCVLMSHSYMRDIYIQLIAPSGASVYLLEKNGWSANDVMSIFSDDADSNASSGLNVNGPGINPPFSPVIRANQPLSIFNGQNRKGWWKLKIIDNAAPDIGYVHTWGLNLTNQRSLGMTSLIQGFYNSSLNKMIRDTAAVYLRNSTAPYALTDSSFSVLDSTGKGNFYFNKAVNGTYYYLVIKHRNSLETWSNAVIKFSNDTLTYNFTTNASKAFGSNLIKVNSLPDKYAIFGGDLNRDRTIDLTDVIQIYNSAAAFESGYVIFDITGDRTVDLSDILIAHNNSAAFVSVKRP